jgi:hypothetical protein
MLTPATAWFLAAWYNRFNFTRAQLIGSVVGFSFLVYYLVPYSQYVRTYATGNLTQNIGVALKYLANLNETKRLYEAGLENIDLSEQQHLFDQRVPFLDRLVMFAPDDALIAFTNKGNVYGLTPILDYNLNVIPHFIWKNKPETNFGNVFAHDLGMVSFEDFTTGISFSPTAEFYREGKWLGLLLVMPLEIFLAFLVADSVAGSTRNSPWAMLWILDYSHAAAEAGAGGPIALYTYGIMIMLWCYWIITRVVPWFLGVIQRNRGVAPAPIAVPESS